MHHHTAARALSCGDPLAALNAVAGDESGHGLALRGIALAQLQELDAEVEVLGSETKLRDDVVRLIRQQRFYNRWKAKGGTPEAGTPDYTAYLLGRRVSDGVIRYAGEKLKRRQYLDELLALTRNELEQKLHDLAHCAEDARGKPATSDESCAVTATLASGCDTTTYTVYSETTGADDPLERWLDDNSKPMPADGALTHRFDPRAQNVGALPQ